MWRKWSFGLASPPYLKIVLEKQRNSWDLVTKHFSDVDFYLQARGWSLFPLSEPPKSPPRSGLLKLSREIGPSLHSVDSVVEEIMRLHRSLPVRPGINEVEAAMAFVHNVDKEELARIDAILKQNKGSEAPEELFFVLQEM